MAKIVALAGGTLGDEASSPAPPSGRTMLVWGAIFGITIGIFVGTLTLNPGRKKA
jgi:hypothetical protein